MTHAAAAGASRSSDRRLRPGWVLATCCLAVFLIGLNTTAINSAVTDIANDLSLSATTLAFAVNSYLLASAIFVLPAGKAADVVGIPTVFAIGLGAFVLGSASIAVAEGAFPLIAGRMLQGAGSAFLMPASMSAIGLAYPPARRGTALGVWSAVVGIAFAVGPLFGGVWTDLVTWRGIYWSDFLIIGVGLALTFTVMRALPKPAKARMDWVDSALVGVSFTLLVLAAQYGYAWGWTSVWTLGCVIGAVVLLAAFAEYDSRRSPDERLVDLSLFGKGPYLGGIILTGFSTAGLINILYFFNLFAQSPVTLDMSAVNASLLLLPYGVAIFVASLGSGYLVDVVGYRLPVAAGLLVAGIGFLMLADLSAPVKTSDLIVPVVLAGIGAGFTFSNPGAAGMSVVPPERAGEASGTINASRYVVAALFLAVSSALYLSIATGTFKSRLAGDGLAASEDASLDAALTGTNTGLQEAIDDVGAGSRSAVEIAADYAITDGFRAAMALMAVISILGAVISVLMLPGRRRA